MVLLHLYGGPCHTDIVFCHGLEGERDWRDLAWFTAFHGPVITASDDPTDYNPAVLGATPNDHQYGYCQKCQLGFRWSVPEQQWVRWHPERRNNGSG